MITCEYKAKDHNTGKILKATVQAESEAAAAKIVTTQGLTPLEIKMRSSEGRKQAQERS